MCTRFVMRHLIRHCHIRKVLYVIIPIFFNKQQKLSHWIVGPVSLHHFSLMLQVEIFCEIFMYNRFIIYTCNSPPRSGCNIIKLNFYIWQTIVLLYQLYVLGCVIIWYSGVFSILDMCILVDALTWLICNLNYLDTKFKEQLQSSSWIMTKPMGI